MRRAEAAGEAARHRCHKTLTPSPTTRTRGHGIVSGDLRGLWLGRYGLYAQIVTEWENYRTKGEFSNSLAMKTFLFQFINSYIALFWNAFYDQDLAKMSITMASLYASMLVTQNVMLFFKPRLEFMVSLRRQGINFFEVVADNSDWRHRRGRFADFTLRSKQDLRPKGLQVVAEPESKMGPGDKAAADAQESKHGGDVVVPVGKEEPAEGHVEEEEEVADVLLTHEEEEEMFEMAKKLFAGGPHSNGHDQRYEDVKAELRKVYGKGCINHHNKHRLKKIAHLRSGSKRNHYRLKVLWTHSRPKQAAEACCHAQGLTVDGSALPPARCLQSAARLPTIGSSSSAGAVRGGRALADAAPPTIGQQRGAARDSAVSLRSSRLTRLLHRLLHRM